MIDSHRVFRPREIRDATGMPLQAIYDALQANELRGVRRGKWWLVGGSAVIEWMESLGESQAVGA